MTTLQVADTNRSSPKSVAAVLQVGALLAVNVAASVAWRTSAARAFANDSFGSAATLVVNVIDGAVIVALALLFSRADGSSCTSLGLAVVPWRRTIGWAALAAIGSKLAAVPLIIISRALGDHGETMLRAVQHVANGPLLTVIALASWAGVWEEVVFRGFILGRLRLTFGRWFASASRADAAAVLVQAAAFALVHIWQSTEGQINAGLSGLVLGYVTIRCGSILPGMIGHALIDLVGLLGSRLL